MRLPRQVTPIVTCRQAQAGRWDDVEKRQRPLAGPRSLHVSCKPNSVPGDSGGDHLSGLTVADELERPTRDAVESFDSSRTSSPGAISGGVAYLVLHAVGFAMPPLSPAERCALTAPFHPYPPRKLFLAACDTKSKFRGGRYILCGTFPDVAVASAAGGRYPPPCPVVFGLSSTPPKRRRGRPLTCEGILRDTRARVRPPGAMRS